MKTNDTQCSHKYIVGYSFRIPDTYNDRVVCDNCGLKIRLALPSRILYWLVDIVSVLITYFILDTVRPELLGGSVLLSLLLATILVLILQQIKRPILRFGKWIEIP